MESCKCPLPEYLIRGGRNLRAVMLDWATGQIPSDDCSEGFGESIKREWHIVTGVRKGVQMFPLLQDRKKIITNITNGMLNTVLCTVCTCACGKWNPMKKSFRKEKKGKERKAIIASNIIIRKKSHNPTLQSIHLSLQSLYNELFSSQRYPEWSDSSWIFQLCIHRWVVTHRVPYLPAVFWKLIFRKSQFLQPRNRDSALDICNLREKPLKALF